jgi:hypothetical protein
MLFYLWPALGPLISFLKTYPDRSLPIQGKIADAEKTCLQDDVRYGGQNRMQER